MKPTQLSKRFISGLRKLQKALKMDNTEFSAVIDISRTTLGRWYSGENKPDAESMDRVIVLAKELYTLTMKDADAVLDFIAMYSPVCKD